MTKRKRRKYQEYDQQVADLLRAAKPGHAYFLHVYHDDNCPLLQMHSESGECTCETRILELQEMVTT